MTPAPCRRLAAAGAWLPAAAGAWLLAAAPLAAVEYYRADRFGTPLTALDGVPDADSGYVLAVDSAAEADAAGLTARRLLLRGGAEVREWRRSAEPAGVELEQELDAGRVVAERRYDAAGRLVDERSYGAAGELLLLEVLLYRGSDLYRVERYDGEGELLAADDYDLTAGGRLRRFTRLPGPAAGAAAAGPAVLALVFGGGDLLEERHGAGAAELIVRTAEGAEYAREEWAGDQLLAARRPAPAVPAAPVAFGAPRAETSFDGRAATRSETNYDDQGRPALVRVFAADEAPAAGDATATGDGGLLLEERRYRYHPDGTLASLEVAGERGLETYAYAYEGAGRRIREEYRRRGRVLRVTTFPAPGEQVDEVYGADGTVLRVFRRDRTPVREELLRDGTVLRARDLTPPPPAGAP